MITKVDGLLISKIPYRERDLICNLLLRNGKKLVVLFYGGRGGGIKRKSSVLELGHFLDIEIQRYKSNSEIYTAKEWNLNWHHKLIRNDFRAYYILCFFMEIIEKVAMLEYLKLDESEFSDLSNEGIFRVLSNAVFYLDKSLQDKINNVENQIAVFMIKVFISQGIYPNIGNCILCSQKLSLEITKILSKEHGGYLCNGCTDLNKSIDQQDLYEIMVQVAKSRYDEIKIENRIPNYILKILVDYFAYQFNLNPNDFKTVNTILGD